MTTSHDPLPDWLTRLLEGPADHPFAPTQGDRGRRQAAPDEPARGGPERGEPLDALVLRGIVIGTSGLVWAAILWLTLRHALR